MPRHQASCTLQALPEHLLSSVLWLCGQEAGPVLTLVCRQWHRLVWEQPAFWRSLHLTPPTEAAALQPWLESKCALLARVAQFVADVSLSGGPNPDAQHAKAVRTLLLALSPAAVHSLRLELRGRLSRATAAALARLTRLHTLDLALGLEDNEALKASAVAALQPALGSLHALSLTALLGSDGALHALLPALGSLRNLALTSFDPPTVDANAWGALQQLTCLRLQVFGDVAPPPLLEPILSQLSMLQRLEAMVIWPDGLLVPPLTCCPTLRELHVFGPILQVPGGTLRAVQNPVAYDDVNILADFSIAAGDGHRRGMVYFGRADLGSAAVLRSCIGLLGPAVAGSIPNLRLISCRIAPGALAGLQQPGGGSSGTSGSGTGGGSDSAAASLLPRTFALLMETCWGADGILETALSDLPRALPSLFIVHLQDMDLSAGLPSGVRQLRNLQLLQCPSCRLAALEGGDWLSSIIGLTLTDNQLSTLPSLAPATTLRRLDLTRNPLTLSGADVDGLLRLPRMTQLLLPAVAAQRGAARLKRGRTSLHLVP